MLDLIKIGIAGVGLVVFLLVVGLIGFAWLVYIPAITVLERCWPATGKKFRSWIRQ